MQRCHSSALSNRCYVHSIAAGWRINRSKAVSYLETHTNKSPCVFELCIRVMKWTLQNDSTVSRSPKAGAVCRAASKSTPRTDPADASLQSQLFPSASPSQSLTGRDKIRKALIELANSDAFLDLIVDQLQSKGLQL